MKYKCSINTVEIIKLCDIEKFNNIIQSLKDYCWIEISLSDIIKIPKKLSDIQSIIQTYIDIKITSTNLVDTLILKNSDIQPLKLTGKMLIVHGVLCEKIIYTSNIYEENHCLNFNIPFNTHIIINKNASTNSEKFKIYSCIENLFVKLLDQRTLVNNIHLFLYAHKISPSKKLTNVIVFNDINSLEIAKIEFDLYYETLILSFTGNISDSNFTFKLLNNDLVEKSNGTIADNQNGENFYNTLKDKPFEYNNIINLLSNKNNQIKIKNFPTLEETYTPLGIAESFKITSKGLIPYRLQNSIIVNNDNSEEILTIYYDLANKILLIHFTDKIAPTSFNNDDYFKFTLMNGNGDITKESLLKKNEDASRFVNSLNNSSALEGYIIELDYFKNTNVVVTNFPNMEEDYNPLGKFSEGFKITPKNLIHYRLQNKIILTNINNEYIITVYFNIENNQLLINATDITSPPQYQTYFKLTLFDSNDSRVKETASILANKDGQQFKLNLNNKLFEFGDIITLEYAKKEKVIISSFPIIESPNYNPKKPIKENFIITRNGLISYVRKSLNSFILNDNVANEIVKVEFDIDNNVLLATSTGRLYNEKVNFSFELKDSNGTTKNTGVLAPNQTGRNFVTSLNDVSFEYNDLILINFSKANEVILTNYPIQNENYTMLGKASQGFKITNKGIIPHSLPNTISLNSENNLPVISFEFDILTKKFLGKSTTEYSNPNYTGQKYFEFTSMDFYGVRTKTNNSINGNETGTNMKNIVIGQSFEYGNIIELYSKEPNKTSITNFKNQGDTYRLKEETEKFKITLNGLESFSSFVNNMITFRGENYVNLATISFDVATKKLIVTSTGKTCHFGFANLDYFSFTIKSNDGTTIKFKSSVKARENANNFKDYFNGKPFEYGDVITLWSKEYFRDRIFNYPNNGDNYGPTYGVTEENFTITQIALKPYPLPQPPIL